MYRIIDEGSRIRVEGAGLLSEGEAREHFEELLLVVAGYRQAGAQVRVLIDLRQAATQSVGTANVILKATDRLYSEPTDRIAILVSSMLLKLQAERIHRQVSCRIFQSIADAEQFLAFGTENAARLAS